MKKFLDVFRLSWHQLRRGLTFLPASLSLLLLCLAFLFIYLDELALADWMRDNTPILVIGSAETARALLTTLVGGIISLTVFSFSMVMIVLNQAASNLSPRLLPDLVADQPHQIVLGVYLGVTIFCILTLMNIRPEANSYGLPVFTIFSSVVLGIVCLALFVYFIGSISHRVQIDHITDELHSSTVKRLKNHPYYQTTYDFRGQPDIRSWHGVPAERSGYLSYVNFGKLSRQAQELDTGVHISTYHGFYVLQGIPLFYVSRELSPEEASRLAGSLSISVETPVDWYLSGIKQLTEVGVRAMSPGINDPGTMLRCIDLLTELLAGCMRLPDRNVYRDPKGADVFFHSVTFENILRIILAEMRQYSKQDVVVMQKLAKLLFFLRQQTAADSKAAQAIDRELKALVEDANAGLNNSLDRDEFTRVLHLAKKELEIVQSGLLIKGEEERRTPGVALK